MLKNKISLNHKFVFYFICNLLIYPVSFLLFHMDSLGTYVKLAIRLIPMGMICLLYLRTILINKRINIFNLLITILIIITAINSLCHKIIDFEGTLYQNSIIAFSLMCLVTVGIEEDCDEYLKSSYFYFYIILVINILFTLIFQPEDQAFLYYNKNISFIFNFPLMLFGYILVEKYQSNRIKIMNIISYVLIIIWSLYTKTYGTLFSLTPMVVYIIFFNNHDYKIFNIWVYLFIIILVFGLFVLPGANNPVVDFVSRILGKEPGFSGRDMVYEWTMRSIAKSPIFGYGFVSSPYSWDLMNLGNPHNMFFDYIIYYGIIIFCYYLFILYFVINTIMNNDNKKISKFLLFAMFCLYFKGMIESAHQDKVVYWLSLLYYFNDNFKNYYISLNFIDFKHKLVR